MAKQGGVEYDGGCSLKLRTVYPKVLRYSEIDGAVCFVKSCPEGFAKNTTRHPFSFLKVSCGDLDVSVVGILGYESIGDVMEGTVNVLYVQRA